MEKVGKIEDGVLSRWTKNEEYLSQSRGNRESNVSAHLINVVHECCASGDHRSDRTAPLYSSAIEVVYCTVGSSWSKH